MSNVAAIDGITGPGRRVLLIQGDVQEVNFKLKKKVIEVLNRDGNLGQYDLAEVSSVNFTVDNKDYMLSIVSAEENEDARVKTGPDGKQAVARDKVPGTTTVTKQTTTVSRTK